MFKEGCGIVGIFGHPEAAKLTYLGLYALQHRGQESAGIVTYDGHRLISYKAQGLVSDVFNEENLRRLTGPMAIGHVRYSTTGSSTVNNAQPIVVNYHGGSLAIAHNGNLINAYELKRELESRGAIFQTSTDSELLVHLIAQASSEDFNEALVSSLVRLKGAYSLVILREDELIALRDPRGFRPLCLGKLDGAYIVASESCALDIMDAQLLREIKPGEIITFRDNQVKCEEPFARQAPSFCVFEYVYYARPDSVVGGKCVYDIRVKLGQRLAREHPTEADLVLPVPDSSNAAGIGYSRQSGIPLELCLIRSHYIGRTFIEPEQRIRDFGAKIKYNPIRHIIADKRVVLVDDSIVRGTTCRKIIKMIRQAGAKEVHFRVSCPPWKFPCCYGIDTPGGEELIASAASIEETRKHIGADTLGYVSLEGLKEVVPRTHGYCFTCFDGQYPGGKPVQFFKEVLEVKTKK